jgi:hypothetical protein
MRFPKPYENERGAVLVTGLLFMTVLAILGTAAYLTSSNELKISKNHRWAKEAHYAAEAGLEEGRGRLRGSGGETYWAGDPNGTPDPNWSAYIVTPTVAADFDPSTDDPQYEDDQRNFFPVAGSYTGTSVLANNIWNLKGNVTTIQYGVKIRHKREFDAKEAGHTTSAPHYIDDDPGYPSVLNEDNRGRIIYYGYEDPDRPYQLVQFTTSGATEHYPVEIIRAYGFGGVFGSDNQSMRVIEIEVGMHPGPEIAATIYSENDIDFSGVANDVDGTNLGAATCGGADLPPTYTLQPANTTWGGAAMPSFNGDPPNPVMGPQDYNVADLVQQYWGMRDITIAPTSPSDCSWNNETWGSPTSPVTLALDCRTGVCPGDTIGFYNCDGYGLLLVDGSLVMSGVCNWTGLILVSDTVTMGGGGGINTLNLQGALMAENTVTSTGNIEADYDSCAIANAFDNHSPTILSWREVY